MPKTMKWPPTLREQQKAIANPSHPLHARVKAEWDEALDKYIDKFSEMAEAMEPYNQEAEDFLALLKSDKTGDFRTLPPMNCLSVILLISKIEDSEETRKKIRVALARHAGGKQRPRGGGREKERDAIYKEWDSFKKEHKNKSDFKDKKSRFISKAAQKFGIERRQTVSDWIRKWDNG